MKVSVIIPALNNGLTIGQTLESVASQEAPREIITVDGGSSDRSSAIAGDYGQVVLSARNGKAWQLNEGAGHASGEVLLFLHADTVLPRYAFATIRHLFEDPTVAGGCFRLAFDVNHPVLNFYSSCTRIPLSSMCTSERAIFVRSEVYRDIGGFPEQDVFEDVAFVREIERRGTFFLLPDRVTASGRRLTQQGMVWNHAKNVGQWLLYMSGISPRRLTSG